MQYAPITSRPIEIPYGDKDQKGDYTLQGEDLVEFNIATDRRDKLHRATNIILIRDTFKINGETRETVSLFLRNHHKRLMFFNGFLMLNELLFVLAHDVISRFLLFSILEL